MRKLRRIEIWWFLGLGLVLETLVRYHFGWKISLPVFAVYIVLFRLWQKAERQKRIERLQSP